MTRAKHPQSNEKTPITMRDAGRKGGLRVKEKYGTAFYTDIGKKGGQALAEKRGSDYFAAIGKKGGDTTLRQHGTKYYVEIGGKGDASRRHSAALAHTDEEATQN